MALSFISTYLVQFLVPEYLSHFAYVFCCPSTIYQPRKTKQLAGLTEIKKKKRLKSAGNAVVLLEDVPIRS